ncbi:MULTISPECIES: alpha/beta hydrolase [Bacillus]|uniref:alpha/beta hydrolase n=1 Tax=Bacillus TaxID=1386 RepID=UPI001D0CE871|nr:MULTISPECIES: alpha/beta hydrolase-fold protein [Bacillus]
MNALNRERMISVYLPKEYENSNKDYPVLYMHDAQNLYRDEDSFFGSSWRIADCLEEIGLELIVVGIDCNAEGTKRTDEFGPWIIEKSINRGLEIDELIDLGGEGEQYINFIVEELKPYIDKKYKTKVDDTAMAGSSAGGLISTYAMCKYPSIFKRVAALSNAYWLSQKEIEELTEKSNLSDIKKFYFDVGTKEQTATFGSDEYINSNISFKNVIDVKNINYRFEIVENAVHNEVAWRERFPAILKYLYQD